VTAAAEPGNYNSPINVELADDASVTTTYKNDGHGFAAKVVFENYLMPNISGGPLGTDKYTFFNFHIHWPSEHTLNGEFFPAELHIVHFNLKYGSIDVALMQPDGIAVVGVFLQVRVERKPKPT
jgi:carbonic anhydrase